MWNPFKKKKPQPKLKVGDLLIGFKYDKKDVWQAYGKETLAYIVSRREVDSCKYEYVIEWIETGNINTYPEESLKEARNEYIKQYAPEIEFVT